MHSNTILSVTPIFGVKNQGASTDSTGTIIVWKYDSGVIQNIFMYIRTSCNANNCSLISIVHLENT